MSLSDDVIVSVQNVSKKFSRRLRHVMMYGATDIARNMVGLSSHSESLREGEFWAVDDVSFELKRGDTLGIIGVNGSGKSTLLKMLNGIYMPDKGRIEIKGKVGALIEVGAGFHPMLTGRENIYINGSILGMSKAEIDRKFNDIVEFADIGDFIDSPVKHYSSGMFVRLGFAIAAHSEPDILLVDEVLAVGDFRFQAACYARINELRARGSSMVLVSHDLRKLQMYCDKGISVSLGRVVFSGSSQAAVAHYLDSNRINGVRNTSALEMLGPRYHNRDKISTVASSWSTSNGNQREVSPGEAIRLDFSFRLLQEVRELVLSVPFYSLDGTYVSGISTDVDGLKVESKGYIKGSLGIHSFNLNPGTYVPVFCVSDGHEFLYREYLDPIVVFSKSISHGLVRLAHDWQFA